MALIRPATRTSPAELFNVPAMSSASRGESRSAGTAALIAANLAVW
ncbi:MAG: hypothetical protein GKR94_04760 [Gammaproteobacteria bacterium]|nr:hypothetical protein [Gammaproteobacteria bacterium]